MEIRVVLRLIKIFIGTFVVDVGVRMCQREIKFYGLRSGDRERNFIGAKRWIYAPSADRKNILEINFFY